MYIEIFHIDLCLSASQRQSKPFISDFVKLLLLSCHWIVI